MPRQVPLLTCVCLHVSVYALWRPQHARRMFLYTARLMAAVQGTQSSPPDVASLNVNGHKYVATAPVVVSSVAH